MRAFSLSAGHRTRGPAAVIADVRDIPPRNLYELCFFFFIIRRRLKIETGLDRDPEIDRGHHSYKKAHHSRRVQCTQWKETKKRDGPFLVDQAICLFFGTWWTIRHPSSTTVSYWHCFNMHWFLEPDVFLLAKRIGLCWGKCVFLGIIFLTRYWEITNYIRLLWSSTICTMQKIVFRCRMGNHPCGGSIFSVFLFSFTNIYIGLYIYIYILVGLKWKLRRYRSSEETIGGSVILRAYNDQ